MDAADASRTERRSPRHESRGSSLSDRQVAFAVRDGRMVTATLSSGEVVEGYIMGTDDYHWALVTADERVVLIHKSAPSLCINRTSSIEDQSVEVQNLATPFRRVVMETHFSVSPDQSRKA